MDDAARERTAADPPRGPRHWPVWLGVGACMALARLPWPLQRALGAGIGWLALHLSRSRRQAARTNLALCLPELDDAQREAPAATRPSKNRNSTSTYC